MWNYHGDFDNLIIHTFPHVVARFDTFHDIADILNLVFRVESFQPLHMAPAFSDSVFRNRESRNQETETENPERIRKMAKSKMSLFRTVTILESVILIPLLS